MKNYQILILISIFAFSCNSKKDVTVSPTQNINRVWMLVTFKEYDKDYFIKKNCFLDMTNKEIASSKMGCNNLSFNYKTNGSKVSFTNGITTEMACEDMKLEYDFSKSILEMSSFSINAHQLLLTSPNGVKMIFVAQDWD